MRGVHTPSERTGTGLTDTAVTVAANSLQGDWISLPPFGCPAEQNTTDKNTTLLLVSKQVSMSQLNTKTRIQTQSLINFKALK